jgi:hypothetical protein
MRELVAWAVRQVRVNLGPVLLLSALAGLAWSLAARGLTGRRCALWLLVPALLTAALVCWVGPGRLFPKVPFEGPRLLHVAPGHSLMLLDIPGILAAGGGAVLAGWLLNDRLRGPGA